MDTPPLPPSVPPPPPPSGPPPPPPAATVPTPSKGNKTLIIVLCVLGFFFILIGGCAIACTMFVKKKASEYSETAKKNPQLAALSFAAAIHPDIQIVSQDEASGKITLRNKKTNEVVTIDTSSYSAQNIGKALEDFSKGVNFPQPAKTKTSEERASSGDDDRPSKTQTSSNATTDDSDSEPAVTPARAAALADVLKKFPPYAPSYPTAKTTEATLNSISGYTAGTYAFHTADKPDAVIDFYEKQIAGARGFSVSSKTSDTNDYGPTSHLTATRSDPAGTFSVSAESQEHGTHVAVSFTQR